MDDKDDTPNYQDILDAVEDWSDGDEIFSHDADIPYVIAEENKSEENKSEEDKDDGSKTEEDESILCDICSSRVEPAEWPTHFVECLRGNLNDRYPDEPLINDIYNSVASQIHNVYNSVNEFFRYQGRPDMVHFDNIEVDAPPSSPRHAINETRRLLDMITEQAFSDPSLQHFLNEFPEQLLRVRLQDDPDFQNLYNLMTAEGGDMESHEYFTRIQEMLGVVEKGVDNIDDVSTIIPNVEEMKREKSDGSICPICQESFLDDKVVLKKVKKTKVIRKTLCNHYYCAECIEKWLAKHKKCPICMIDLEDLKNQKNNI